MKLIIIFFATAIITMKDNCNDGKQTHCFKGRLEIKGICSNYTIKLLEGTPDTSLIAAQWKDENTGKEYKNVFALASPCTFPENINEGDDFYFVIDTQTKQTCDVCMAYYPTPPKRLSIRVLNEKCRE